MRDFLAFILQESVIMPTVLCFVLVWLICLAHSNTKRLQRNYLRRIEECAERFQKTKDDFTEYHAKHLRDIPEEAIKEGDRAVIGNDHYERVQNYWELSESETVSGVFEKMEQDQIDDLKSLIEQVMTLNEYRQSIGLKPVDTIEPIELEELPQNCPNCGAPVFDSVCPYCDTRFAHKVRPEATMLQVQLENTKRVEELYEEAINAFKSYHA